jgi:predicted TIM-barrel fold metal-dependent hydrolase
VTEGRPAGRQNSDIPLPNGACDCHMHVFGPYARFPLAQGRSYTPPESTLARYRETARGLGLDRVVIVQPSTYGTDNRCLAAALQECDGDARGIAVIDETTADAALDHLDRIGVRGVRLNALSNGRTDPGALAASLDATARRIKGRGWHIQIYSDLGQIEASAAAIGACPVPVVVDHFGVARGALGAAQPGFQTLLRLVAEGSAWVKLSGADRLSDAGSGYADMAPLVEALCAANPERLLWGSDWPHTPLHSHGQEKGAQASAFRDVDDGGLLAALRSWLRDEDQLRRVLVTNPARLYGFGEWKPEHQR